MLFRSKAKPNNNNEERHKYPVRIATPRPDGDGKFYGYEPENQVGNGKSRPKSYLHDCTHFYIVIYPQDDIKSHIIQ